MSSGCPRLREGPGQCLHKDKAMNIAAASLLLSAGSGRRHRPRASVLDRLLRRIDARKDHRHLASLPDHLLRDMGFTRDQIGDVLRGQVRRP